MKKISNQINLRVIIFFLLGNKIKIISLTLLIFIIISLLSINQNKNYLQMQYVVNLKTPDINIKYLNSNNLDLTDFQRYIYNESNFLENFKYKKKFAKFIYLEQKKYNLNFKDLVIAESFVSENFKYLPSKNGSKIILSYNSDFDGVKLLNDYLDDVITNSRERIINLVLNKYLILELDLINNLEIAKKLNINSPSLFITKNNFNSNNLYLHGILVLSEMITNNKKTIEKIKNLNIELDLYDKNMGPNFIYKNSKKLIISLSFLVSVFISLFIFLIIILFKNKKN